MTSLVIKNKDEIKLIFDLALQLREQTPYSFRILANKLGFLKPNNQEEKNQGIDYEETPEFAAQMK